MNTERNGHRRVLTWLAVCVVTVAVGLAIFRRDVLWWGLQIPNDAVREVNRGQICVAIKSNDHGAILASVRPEADKCLSSSCTELYIQDANVLVSQATFSLHFNSIFAYRDLSPEKKLCTRDCMALPGVQLDLGNIRPGYYSVWLGTTWLGQIELPTAGSAEGRDCVTSSRPSGFLPMPTPTAVMLTTAEPYPMPLPTDTTSPTINGYPESATAPDLPA